MPEVLTEKAEEVSTEKCLNFGKTECLNFCGCERVKPRVVEGNESFQDEATHIVKRQYLEVPFTPREDYYHAVQKISLCSNFGKTDCSYVKTSLPEDCLDCSNYYQGDYY